MRLFFYLTAVGLAIAVLSGAALSWDGSFYFFGTVDSGQPFVPNDRLINIPLHRLVLFVEKLTGNMFVLRTTFGLAHASTTVLALVASWLIVRDNNPALFVWPALGIGLGMLPGTFFIVSEGNKVAILSWPILLGIVTLFQEKNSPIISLFVLLVFVTHPESVLLFATFSGLCVVFGIRFSTHRQKMLRWAFVFGILTLFRYLMIRGDYEAGEMSVHLQIQYFKDSVLGWPLAAVVCAWLGCALILVAANVSRMKTSQVTKWSAMLATALCGLFLVRWASDPFLWRNELSFKSFATFGTLPFMLAAALDVFKPGSFSCQLPPGTLRFRTSIVQATGIVFIIVLTIQSIQFVHLSNDLRKTIAASESACVPMSALGSLQTTALNHWSISTYSIVIQGREPLKLVLEDDACAKLASSGALWIVPWEQYQGPGWFNLETVRARVAGSQHS